MCDALLLVYFGQSVARLLFYDLDIYLRNTMLYRIHYDAGLWVNSVLPEFAHPPTVNKQINNKIQCRIAIFGTNIINPISKYQSNFTLSYNYLIISM